MEIVTEAIQTFGFPIAVAVGAFYFIYKIYWALMEDNKADKERLYSVLADANNTNASILSANKEILESNRDLMNDLKKDIGDIKNAVIK